MRWRVYSPLMGGQWGWLLGAVVIGGLGVLVLWDPGRIWVSFAWIFGCLMAGLVVGQYRLEASDWSFRVTEGESGASGGGVRAWKAALKTWKIRIYGYLLALVGAVVLELMGLGRFGQLWFVVAFMGAGVVHQWQVSREIERLRAERDRL